MTQEFAAIEKAVSRRNVAGLRDVPEDRFLAYLDSVWEAEAGRDTPDFERLFATGELARHFAAEPVRRRFDAWRQRLGDTDRALCVAGLFLWGYWQGGKPADADLAAWLLDGLAEDGRDFFTTEALILALAEAYGGLAEVPLKQRIHDRLAALRQARETKGYEPAVRRAFERVLGTQR